MSGRNGGDTEREGRLDALCGALAARGASAVVLDRRHDLYYFTGYTGSDALAVVSTRTRRGWLATDLRYTEEAEKTAPGLETVVWKKNFGGFVGQLLRKNRFRHIAYTPASLSAAFYLAMLEEAGGKVKWTDADDEILRLRSVKSPSEIRAVRKALACAESAFLAARKRWKIGMTETEVRNDLEWEMRRRGAEDTAFETIVAAGPNASLPHAHAGTRKIQGGKMLLIDFGASLGCYNSDLTRTLWAGEIPGRWRERYREVLAAQQAGIEAIGPGVSGKTVDDAARKVFVRAGLDARFTHGLGHGVGLAVHEEPRLSRAYDRPLEPGNVVTVEPGVYFPGSGGIRIEDMVLVEKKGARVLSSLPKAIEDMVL